MFNKILGGIRSAFEHVDHFLMALFRMPTKPSAPNSAAAERAKAAKQVRGAMHVQGAAGGSSSGSSGADGLFGKALADGHEKARGTTAPPRAR